MTGLACCPSPSKEAPPGEGEAGPDEEDGGEGAEGGEGLADEAEELSGVEEAGKDAQATSEVLLLEVVGTGEDGLLAEVEIQHGAEVRLAAPATVEHEG